MPQDQGRARQAGHHGLGDQDPHAAAGERARPGPPARRPTWSEFLQAKAKGILALDFFTVETLMLSSIVLRHVVRLIAGCSNDELSSEVELLVARHH